jgi:hypothetical protein
MRRTFTARRLAIFGLLTAFLTSCASSPWVITPGYPQLHVLVSSNCPAALGGARDVVNSYTGDQLVPSDPASGMICRYRASLEQPGETGAPGSLYSSVELATRAAVHLAAVIDSISTAAPQGTVACPSDDGSASIIAFAYAARADVSLWFADSGCEMLDNGRIGAWEVGNPSFYNNFLTLINDLAPQQSA